MIVGLSDSFTRKMVSPSVVGAAVATARADPGAITATTTAMKVAAATVYLMQIPSRCRCLHQRMSSQEGPGGYQEPRGFAACLLGGAQAPLSNRHFK
jgi:hypothetical protein